jgi:outer membrane murein-binding lipoprotein Lpp
MGPTQPARRVTQDRARRSPVIRPDYLKLYRVKEGPDAKSAAPSPAAEAGAPPARRPRGTRAFLIAIIAAVAVNSGALLGLVGWGVLQAFGLFGEPAIETMQREQAASISKLDASVQALNASVTGLSAHVNSTGEREDAAGRRIAEMGEAIGALRSGLNEVRAARAAGEEPWREPMAELAASVGKLRTDVNGLRASLDAANRPPPALGVRVERIERAMIAHNLMGPIRGAIEPGARPGTPAREDPATADGHIISLPPAE